LLGLVLSGFGQEAIGFRGIVKIRQTWDPAVRFKTCILIILPYLKKDRVVFQFRASEIDQKLMAWRQRKKSSFSLIQASFT